MNDRLDRRWQAIVERGYDSSSLNKPRPWFRFSFRVLLAMVTGAAVGLGTAPIVATDLPMFLRIGAFGPAGLVALFVVATAQNRSSVPYATMGPMAVLYALYGAALAQWPRWSTVLWIGGLHALGALAMFGVLGALVD